ncbi:MAG: hypothetical protein SGILL_007183, partial [Bacillariaceae sp.]
MILANPHSTGPAASRTLFKVKQAKSLVLKHLDAMPGRFASLQLPESFYDQDSAAENSTTTSSISVKDRHAGYDVVFTSGATEGFKTIAERFPWRSGSSEDDWQAEKKCSTCRRHKPLRLRQHRSSSKQQSILLYTANSHNSVVGMRQLAKRQGAIFHCCDMKALESMTVQDFKTLEEQLLHKAPGSEINGDDQQQDTSSGDVCHCKDENVDAVND